MTQIGGLRTLSTTADTSAVRQETWNGRDYTVVPVVALVEGVLQGLNAENPEFAPYSEFAKFPDGWNGRPVVMNHPMVNGQLVSANSPEVLTDWQMGFMFNSVGEDKKLKTEAWIDNGLVAEKGGEFQSTLDRLIANGEPVEVSTGLYTEITAENSSFKGNTYKGRWQNVVPDHLAILSAGSTGACSVEDGCGAPRLNAVANMAQGMRVANSHIQTSSGSCCDACSKGEPCVSTTATSPQANEGEGGNDAPPASEAATTENGNAPAASDDGNTPAGSPSGAATGDGEAEAEAVDTQEGGAEGDSDGAGSAAQQTPEQVTQELADNKGAAHVIAGLAANSIAPGVTIDDAESVVQQALRSWLNRRVYVVAMTTEIVAYYAYSYDDYDYGSSQTMALAYSVAEGGGVTFTGDPYPVNIICQIVPVAAPAVSANGASQGDNSQEGSQMSGNTTDANGGNEGQPAANGSGGAPKTLEQYLAEAPTGVAEVLQSGIKMHNERRGALIKGLVDHESKVFTAEQLEGKSIDELEQLTTLAGIKPTFNGVAFGSGNVGVSTDLAANADANRVPAPPRAFEYAAGVDTTRPGYTPAAN